MKKIVSLLILLCLFIIPSFPQLEASLLIHAESEVTHYIEGVRHTKIVGEISYYNENTEETIRTKQVINYLGAHVQLSSDLHVIVGDNYQDFGWGMGNIHAIKENIHQRYSDYQVIAGVNGDFYNMTTGHPVAAYIRNFEVLTTGNLRPLVGFKDNGETVFGIPQWGSFEMLVFDQDGDIKYKTDIAGINRIPQIGQLTVYFDDYPSFINNDLEKVVIQANDMKKDDWQTRYFGKGNPIRMTHDPILLEENQFVIVGSILSEYPLYQETDTVVVQRKPVGLFENTRFAIGVWEKLVENGRPLTSWTEGAIPTSRAPRTAIGVTQGGSVFFVTVDGRQPHLGMEGVTHREMAAIMSNFGARTAYNLDGGGSTTALIKDSEQDVYLIANHPSDGQLRIVSNGLFIVKGKHPKLPEILPFPDYRTQLDVPKQIHVDDQGNLRFVHVPNSTHYHLSINDTVIETKDPVYPLLLPPGSYEIKVRALGNKQLFASSFYSEPIIVHIYPNEIEQLMKLFRNSMRKETVKQD